MEFSNDVLKNKRKYYNTITKDSLLIKKVLNKYIKGYYKIEKIFRNWEPGGGSSLFKVVTDKDAFFLKVMNLNINIESKLEKEKDFIKIPSIKNEYNFIKLISKKIGKIHVPKIIFYEEFEEYGFLATEFLESFEETVGDLSIEEIIDAYTEIFLFIKNLFKNSIVHTDVHESNIRFRGETPVVIDYGETRFFTQKTLFINSLDYLGKNRYGNVGTIPYKKDYINGFTCLKRLKKVFNNYMEVKIIKHAENCNFDNTCPFNKDILQIPDNRIYQSIKTKNLHIRGQRSLKDLRLSLLKIFFTLISIKFRKICYIDIGSNLGNFCFQISKIKNVCRVIGVEAYKDYILFAEGLKFILEDKKTIFLNLLCGQDDIYQNIDIRKDLITIITVLSTYHHIENKEKFFDDIMKNKPIAIIMELATQERYYKARGNWQNEIKYIKEKLKTTFFLNITISHDYKRPIVIFTNNAFIKNIMLILKIFIKLYQILKKGIYIPKNLFSRLKTYLKQSRVKGEKTSYYLALQWLIRHYISGKGIAISSKKNISYPEVSGYIIPTLYEWGERSLAREIINWLIKNQNLTGSFSAPNGIPYTFDTGQVIRGFVAVLDNLPEVEKPLRKACDWILTQVQPNGKLSSPSTEMWGEIADERIHLYVLPPLIEAGEKLNEPKYIDTADHILEYYKQKKDLIEFNTLSHFYAYIIEALCDLGEENLARASMEKVAQLQSRNGSVSAYKNVEWICSPGLAQFSVIWYKLGMREYADKAMHYLEKIQNQDGGFYGSYGKKANYFPKEAISWTVKFFLDAYYWKVKTSFNQEVDIFPELIDQNDSRVQEILSFFGDLNGKKVIDIGCGKGRFLRILQKLFPKSNLYGLDISEKMLSFCSDGIETKCGSLLNIKYPDAYFDCVYCIELLEHSLMLENAIEEMVRILKPGGKIVIIDKNITKLGKLKIKPWEQWFKPKKLIKLLSKYSVKANCKPIVYEKAHQSNGLFLAWDGIKNV